MIRVLGKERVILQHDCGGFRIDMVIKSKNNDRPYIAIEADGAKYHSSREAYLWDLFRQEQLEQFGFKFYRVWSTNWWRNREKEEERMIHFVRRMDEAEAVLY
jgi:very-short-patch-repair endonuclease